MGTLVKIRQQEIKLELLKNHLLRVGWDLWDHRSSIGNANQLSVFLYDTGPDVTPPGGSCARLIVVES